jgi:hypothetical protein
MAYEPEDDEFPYSFDMVIEGVFALAIGADVTDCKEKTSE